MTTYSWGSGGSADWGSASAWSPETVPDSKTADAFISLGGAYTVTIASAEHVLVDSLTFAPGNGSADPAASLALNGTLTLGGARAGMAIDSGTVDLAGTISGGPVTLDGGVLAATGAAALTGAVDLDSGTLDIAPGQILALSATVAWNGGDVATSGAATTAGTLVTTGHTTLTNTAFIDGGLVWINSGTVNDSQFSIVDDQNTPADNLIESITNQATGIFDFGDGGFVIESNPGNSDTPTFFNRGLLEVGSGTTSDNLNAVLTNTGSVSVAFGTLDLSNGGALGGTISVAANASLLIGGTTATLSASVTNSGSLALDSATTTFSGSIANSGVVALGGVIDCTGTILGGTVDLDTGTLNWNSTGVLDGTATLTAGTIALAAGKTLTLTGALAWGSAEVLGPGTLLTTGATTIDGNAEFAFGPTWINSGTVLFDDSVAVGDGGSDDTESCIVVNRAGGTFDLAAGGIGQSSHETTTLSNAGLFEMTGPAAVAGSPVPLLVEAVLNSTGTVAVASGTLELLDGGTLGGTVTIAAASELVLQGGSFAMNGAFGNGGTLAVQGNATVGFGATALTIANAVTLDGGAVMVASGQTLTLSGAVTWEGGGVGGPGTLLTTGVTAAGTIGTDGAYLELGLTWINSGTVLQSAYDLANASAPESAIVNEASGTFDFIADGYAAINEENGATTNFANAGLLEKTAGTAEVTFGYTLDSTGEVTATAGTLDLDGGGTLAGRIGGTGGGVVLLDTTAFVTSGSLAILDGGTADALGIVTAAIWTVGGSVGDAGNVALGSNDGTTSAITIAVGGSFDFTSDDGNILADGGAALSNAGSIGKAAGSGTSRIGVAVSSIGTITATSGTLDLSGGGTLAGHLGGTGSGVVLLDGAGFATTGSLDILDAAGSTGLLLVNGAIWTDSGTIGDGGAIGFGTSAAVSTLDVAATATFDFSDDDASLLGGTGAALSNAGLIAKVGGTGTSGVAFGFANTGTVLAGSGTLRLGGSVSGDGTLEILAGATLDLDAADEGGAILFSLPGGGRLNLASAGAVGGDLISGFMVGDEIAIVGAVGAATSITESGGTATLALSLGGASLGALSFAGTPALQFSSATGIVSFASRVVQDNPDGTSLVTTYTTAGISTATSYGGADGGGAVTGIVVTNAAGFVTETDQENADGTSLITTYDTDGSSLATTYDGPEGTGAVAEIDQENADGTSKITIENTDGGSTTTSYAGKNGTGAISTIDQENTDGTSQITTYASNGSVNVTKYSGPNGTGTVLSTSNTDQDGFPFSILASNVAVGSDGLSYFQFQIPSLSNANLDFFYENGGNSFSFTVSALPSTPGGLPQVIGGGDDLYPWFGALLGPGDYQVTVDCSTGPPMAYSASLTQVAYQATAIDMGTLDSPENIDTSPSAGLFPQHIMGAMDGSSMEDSYKFTIIHDETVQTALQMLEGNDDFVPQLSISTTNGVVNTATEETTGYYYDEFVYNLSPGTYTLEAQGTVGTNVAVFTGYSLNTQILSSIVHAVGPYWLGGGGDLSGTNWVTGYSYSTDTSSFIADVTGSVPADAHVAFVAELPAPDVTAVGAGGVLTGALACASALFGSGADYRLDGNITAGSATIDNSTTLDIAAGGELSAQIVIVSGHSDLVLQSGGVVSGLIAGFSMGDRIDLTGLDFAGNKVGTLAGDVLSATEGAVTQTLTLDTFGVVGDSYVLADDGSGGTEVTVACFREGTRIATVAGEVAVEHLAVGDLLPTRFAELARIVWLGRRRVDCRRHLHPENIWPVRVRADVFGGQRPARDLWLSPDHAIFVGGALVPVRHLIDGDAIVQQPCHAVVYWHVELARHDVILAEGLPCESFLDTGNRGAFANGGSAVQLHPDFASRQWDGDACTPLVVDGPSLDRVRAALEQQIGLERLPEIKSRTSTK